jgi:hypothetical protein
VGWIATINCRPIVQRLVLSLGLGYNLEGIKMMQSNFALPVVASGLRLSFLLFR